MPLSVWTVVVWLTECGCVRWQAQRINARVQERLEAGHRPPRNMAVQEEKQRYVDVRMDLAHAAGEVRAPLVKPDLVLRRVRGHPHGPVIGDVVQNFLCHSLPLVDDLRRGGGRTVGTGSERHCDMKRKPITTCNFRFALSFLMPNNLVVFFLRVRVELVDVEDLPVLWRSGLQDTILE